MGWNSVAEAHQFGATLFTLLPSVILLVLAVCGAWSVFKQFVEWKAQALDRHRQELETAMKAAASSREDARLILENELFLPQFLLPLERLLPLKIEKDNGPKHYTYCRRDKKIPIILPDGR